MDKHIIVFKNEAHEVFYKIHLSLCRQQDNYHKALIYCLGMSEDTRKNINQIYDFETACVKTECLHESWITSGSSRIVRIAFNLYCNGTPSVSDCENLIEQLKECQLYTVENIFCSGYAKYFMEAVKLRYPDYYFYKDCEDM